MKLINLNLWTGKIHDPLIEFIKTKKDETDIFCFQEVSKSDRNIFSHGSYSNLLEELSDLLPNYQCYFAPIGSGYDTSGRVDFPFYIGQAMFIKKDFKIINEGEIFVYRKSGDMGTPYPDGRGDFPRNFLYSEIEKTHSENPGQAGKRFLVLNLHGFWEPKPKYDTPQRFKQSEIILDFIEKQKLPTVLVGDFNVGMDTKCLLMLEERLTNLVRSHNTPTTRSNLYDPYYKNHDKFADYILVTSDIEVKSFEVLQNQISDHLPLYLDFEV